MSHDLVSAVDDGSAQLFAKSLLASAFSQFATQAGAGSNNGCNKMGSSNGHTKSNNGYSLTNGTAISELSATTQRTRSHHQSHESNSMVKGANANASQGKEADKVANSNNVMKEATKRRDDYQRMATTRSEQMTNGGDKSIDHNDQLDSANQSLCKINDVPQYLRFNPFILTGYRVPAMTSKECLKSLGYFHNETVNILTHGKYMVQVRTLNNSNTLAPQSTPRQNM